MTMISKTELLRQLNGQVSAEERAALENGGVGLVISQYNRRTLLGMLSTGEAALRAEAPEERRIDPGHVGALRSALEGFLAQYMSDRPEGHKWIILSCLYLAFVAGEPMHPQEVVRWTYRCGEYRCPAREDTEGSLCRWCVCAGTQ